MAITSLVLEPDWPLRVFPQGFLSIWRGADGTLRFCHSNTESGGDVIVFHLQGPECFSISVSTLGRGLRVLTPERDY